MTLVKIEWSSTLLRLAIFVSTDTVVWVDGPFPCGPLNDRSIFSTRLKQKLLDGEILSQIAYIMA